jgi:hypothetical protein
MEALILLTFLATGLTGFFTGYWASRPHSVPAPAPARTFPRPVYIKHYVGLNPIALHGATKLDVNGKFVTFLLVEHDEMFPFLNLPNPRRRTWVHPDHVTEIG